MVHFLVVESETPEDREKRRKSAGKSSGETFAATLAQLRPDARTSRVAPSDGDEHVLPAHVLANFDAVFLSGSPLHVYDPSPEVERQLALMRAVYAAGVPAFGSCAGLQVAVAAAGGRVRRIPARMEAGIGRRITRTEAGAGHPLLARRPAAWDAPSIHGDEVETLPEGAVCLAGNGASRVQAAEIRHDRGVFWGVQYHPELAPGEIAAALRRQSDDLIDEGIADTPAAVERVATLLDRVQRRPDDHAARWELGIDDSFAVEEQRRSELRNFLGHLDRLRNGANG